MCLGLLINFVVLVEISGGSVCGVHSKLHSITTVATKVHVILRSFSMLTWMRDTIELV